MVLNEEEELNNYLIKSTYEKVGVFYFAYKETDNGGSDNEQRTNI